MLGLGPQLAGSSYYSQDSLAQRASYDTLGMLPAAAPPSLTIASSNPLNVYQVWLGGWVEGGGAGWVGGGALVLGGWEGRCCQVA